MEVSTAITYLLPRLRSTLIIAVVVDSGIDFNYLQGNSDEEAQDNDQESNIDDEELDSEESEGDQSDEKDDQKAKVQKKQANGGKFSNLNKLKYCLNIRSPCLLLTFT